ncbi:MAG: hypothetical protein WHS38_06335 [Thermodesulforhabdaceae bacterium]
MKKVVICAFRGEPMCFIHVLLNALDMYEKGLEGKIIVEGESVKLIPEMEKPDHFLHSLYLRAKTANLIVAVCRACSQKLGVLEAVEASGLPVVADMMGHVSIGKFIAEGYEIITL